MLRAQRTILFVILAAGLVASSPAATAPRFHSIDTFTYDLALTRSSTVPRPTSATYVAGRFSGTLVIVRGHPRATLTWHLQLWRSGGRMGPDISAHVHTGRSGDRGLAVVQLCFACKSGAGGRLTLATPLARLISSAAWTGGAPRAYVDVHSARNPSGELRGALAEARWRGSN